MPVNTPTRLVLALGLPLLAGGCAPSFGGAAFGPGLHVGLGLGGAPRLAISPATCLLQGSSSMTETPSAAATAGALRQQVAHIQAKHSLGAGSLALQMESWKRLASGGC